MKFSLPMPKMIEETRNLREGNWLLLEIIIFICVYIIAGMVLQGMLTLIPTLMALFSSPEFQQLLDRSADYATVSDPSYINGIIAELSSNPLIVLSSLFSTVALIAGALVYCRAIEKRPFRTMGFRRGHAIREYLVGAAIGLVAMGICVVICLASGASVIDASKGIGSVAPSAMAPTLGLIALFFVGFIIQGAGEEILLRGYLMVSLAARQRLIVAAIVSAAAFSALHLLNPGALDSPLALLNIMLFGVFAGVYMMKRGSIWGVAGIHAFWNFAQGVVFGIPVSGAFQMDSLVKISATEGSQFFTFLSGGNFGVEGGLVATIVLAIALIITLVVPARKDEVAVCE
ncbi:MAG: CPBP family intramembrane metalloprotease [Coriobacteriales bacterium]|jgi:membrane protease YdiL (CAAX protease family)|nr:CPBP family intramembrane metalloprotease [Coriobacteriales bacterium]